MKTLKNGSKLGDKKSNSDLSPHHLSSKLVGETGELSREKIKDNLECGDCLGYQYMPIHEARCAEVGRLITSHTCGSYKPNLFKLKEVMNISNGALMMSDLIACVPTNSLKLLSALFLYEKETRRRGFHFFQPVWVRIRGCSNSNYLSNFMRAFVLCADKECVYLTNKDFTLSIQKLQSDIMLDKDFQVLRKKMIEQGKISDPELLSRSVPFNTENEPISHVKQAKKKKEHSPHDLVRIVRELQKGHLLIDDFADKTHSGFDFEDGKDDDVEEEIPLVITDFDDVEEKLADPVILPDIDDDEIMVSRQYLAQPKPAKPSKSSIRRVVR